MSNKLVKIDPVDWPKLRDLYKENWPKYHQPYYTINNYLEWFQKDPKNVADIEIFSLNGDWNDGTYLIIDSGALCIFCTLNESLDRLTDLLCLVHEKNLFFAAFSERIKPAVMKVFDMYDYEIKNDREMTVWYHITNEEALQFDDTLPPGYVFKSLTVDDARTAFEVWPFREKGTLEFVERLIRLSPSLGIYDEITGELLAWCLRLTIGSLGLLQVKDTHMRKGLGSLVVKGISKKFAKLGYDVSAPVVAENTPSRNLFTKLGFREFDKVFWMFYGKK